MDEVNDNLGFSAMLQWETQSKPYMATALPDGIQGLAWPM